MNDENTRSRAVILTPGLGEYIAQRGGVVSVAPGAILHG